MVREAIGDVEAKFYAPGFGFVIDLVEAKNHTLAPAEFWDEIRRFQELDAGSSGTYRRFTIACTGISESLQPLLNALRRIRDSWDFYLPASGVQNNSFKDYLRIITKLRKTEHDARFLFDKVVIQPNFNAAQTPGEALFTKALIDHLSEYQDLPSRIVREIYANLDQLLRSRKNQPITRLELETAVRTKITSAHLHLPPLRPIVLTTLSQEAPCLDAPELQLDWRSFFGGEVRSYPPADVWNSQLVSELYAIRGWILKHRGNRRIRLEGNRRLSAALSLGFVFSAVAGFAIEINYRGKTWATDAYATAETVTHATPNIRFRQQCQQVAANDLTGFNDSALRIGFVPKPEGKTAMLHQRDNPLALMKWHLERPEDLPRHLCPLADMTFGCDAAIRFNFSCSRFCYIMQ